MRPIISSGSIEISSYALMLCIGACVSLWLTLRQLRRTRLEDAMVTLTAIMLAGGILGARATSIVLNRGLYEGAAILSIFTIWDPGGMWFFGGFLVAGLAGLAWILARGIPVMEAADTLALAWVPFIAFIRVGCFLNGCCYGRPTTSFFGLVTGGSLNNANFGIPSHPTQLYAVAATLALAGILWRRARRQRFTGELTVMFLVFYSAFTFAHEFLRGDPRIAWSFGEFGVLTLNQIVSLLLVVTGIVLWVKLRPRGSAQPPNDWTTPSPTARAAGAL